MMPAACAACGESEERLSWEVCGRCAAAVDRLRAGPTRPTPAPDGLPPCFALGEYGGELRELIIGYKDRGRHRLAHPLGALLAEVVATALPGDGPVLVLFVPDTGAAARERYGDHMRRLARAA
ncbi:ComF family protein, partial [Allorhizocola rhizosphaerae]|uniref:ComF family protein n=1 Tax=Allorhizocola rhizosphaerae TaxID=1872709 RepID=UPI003CCC6F7D